MQSQFNQSATDSREDKEAEIKDDLPFPANDHWTYLRKLGKRRLIC